MPSLSPDDDIVIRVTVEDSATSDRGSHTCRVTDDGFFELPSEIVDGIILSFGGLYREVRNVQVMPEISWFARRTDAVFFFD